MTREEERQQAAAIDVEGRQANVATILHGDKPQVQAFEYSEAKPPKKRRSDAGVPRKPRTQPSEQAPGVLTREQANKLVELIEEKERRHVAYEAAQTHAEKCDKALASAARLQGRRCALRRHHAGNVPPRLWRREQARTTSIAKGESCIYLARNGGRRLTRSQTAVFAMPAGISNISSAENLFLPGTSAIVFTCLRILSPSKRRRGRFRTAAQKRFCFTR